MRPTDRSPPEIPAGRGSQIDYAVRALGLKGEPLSTADLIPEMEKIGGKVGGKDPSGNLASVLSKSGRVKVVPWKGAKRWWPADKPVPASGHAVAT